MKKVLLTLSAVFLISLTGASAELVPYYNYLLTQGVSVSPEGDLGFLITLSNDIGTIYKPLDNHTFIGYYSLMYQGPGLKRQEGREFRERYLNHVFAGRHHWDIGDITIKNQLSILMERRRSGTNETWESGLYNFNRFGGSSAATTKLWGIESTLSLGYHFLSFPNYSDLLAELRGGADASDTSGTQNHHSIRVAYTGTVGRNTFWLSLNPLLYTKQRVAVDEAQADGTFYSSTKQREMVYNLGAKKALRLTGALSAAPEVDLTIRVSNQNYLHYDDVTSTSPASVNPFHEKFFNYVEPSLSLPMSVTLGRAWSYFLNPSWSYRVYTNRAPRNSEGEFIEGEKQNRLLGIYTTGFRRQTGESSATVFFFTFQNQSSNMKFERYIPYNYSGLSAGIRFQMEY